jgi:glycosyltransferase involved in cell wall biosynthesis
VPLVTAICPTANRQDWIPLAIACFLAQTYTDSELLIVDDGDRPTPVPEHPRVRYIRLPHWEDPQGRPHRKTRPTGAKRNRCCEEASGEVIVHWDDDDWYAPTRIESQLAQLNESGKSLVGYHRISFWDTSPGAAHRAFQYVGDRPYCSGTSQMYLKPYWQRHKFDPNKWVGEDSDFSAAARAEGNIASFDGTQMVVARAHSDSTCPPNLGGHSQFPQVSEGQIPAAFRQAIGAL